MTISLGIYPIFRQTHLILSDVRFFPMSIPGPGQCLFHFPGASLGVPLNAEEPDRSTAQGLGGF